jgi:hypothetical protein
MTPSSTTPSTGADARQQRGLSLDNSTILSRRPRCFASPRTMIESPNMRGCEPMAASRSRGGDRVSSRLTVKNPAAPAVKREAEEEWGKERWR